jgi:glutamate dehydrogenase
VLRKRETRGALDLHHDVSSMSRDELLRRQLSFSKSRHRARVHRQAYPITSRSRSTTARAL